MPNKNSNVNILAMLAIDGNNIKQEYVAGKIVLRGQESGFNYIQANEDGGDSLCKLIGYKMALMDILPEILKLKELAIEAGKVVDHLKDF